MNNLERKFNQFDAENGHVWLLFLQFADQVRLTGRLVYSVNAIFERMRWHTDIETRSDTEFKLSNNHRAYYARKYMNSHPNRAGFFRTKLVIGERTMDTPTIYATKETINGTDVLTFECTKCGKKHTHGSGEGHRVEHCDHDAKARWEHGYFLKEDHNAGE